MKLFIAICITLVAFAANSILNRMALASSLIDPASFACIRVGSGAIVLFIIVMFKGAVKQMISIPDIKAVLALGAYMLGFSFAYINLDAGIGALILFGAVQITMFIGAIIKGQKPGLVQWIGAAVAFAGLIYLLLPKEFAPDVTSLGLMVVAGIGWGIYSLRGQLVTDSIQSTALNFLWCFPLSLIALLLITDINISNHGFLLAIFSGSITSALGYALWYRILPLLNTVTASVSQLTVPIIAMIGGILFLNESVTMTFVIASAMVLGGVGLSVYGGQVK